MRNNPPKGDSSPVRKWLRRCCSVRRSDCWERPLFDDFCLGSDTAGYPTGIILPLAIGQWGLVRF